MKLYEFAGRIVGKCLYESSLGGTYKQMVKARFSRSFLAQLIGLRVTYKVSRREKLLGLLKKYIPKFNYREGNYEFFDVLA